MPRAERYVPVDKVDCLTSCCPNAVRTVPIARIHLCIASLLRPVLAIFYSWSLATPAVVSFQELQTKATDRLRDTLQRWSFSLAKTRDHVPSAGTLSFDRIAGPMAAAQIPRPR